MGIKVPLNHFNSDRRNPFRKLAADSCLDTALSLYNNSRKGPIYTNYVFYKAHFLMFR